ncbi:uncharacterized protein MCYG_07354 [Microsporum canis CBS 113480]|uniref:Uncharacterized protein n=1 Tax=Arthroderma otae (strain ATCC MYA-4605 / CBS 113480) TaxID=554155 RepID=C5FYD7_ARTOC|nr:uncharacterized protein MCYG_07354 [Microsporum canis CBS 113480]EEQ34535.1 predicted protein [Microsporum canis CBS 113480]
MSRRLSLTYLEHSFCCGLRDINGRRTGHLVKTALPLGMGRRYREEAPAFIQRDGQTAARIGDAEPGMQSKRNNKITKDRRRVLNWLRIQKYKLNAYKKDGLWLRWASNRAEHLEALKHRTHTERKYGRGRSHALAWYILMLLS